MKIVVIGGTGLIGSPLVKMLQERGQEAVAASPSKGVNAVTGEGLAAALAGADVVVDDSKTVPATFFCRRVHSTGSERLLGTGGRPTAS